ncbi:MAG: hypothetical protein V2A58_00435 [Planctomycetota bacterium]
MVRLDSSLLHIGKNRQLFFDNKIIERAQDVTRVFHTPKAEAEPLIQSDRPWEHITYFALGTYHVLRDRDGRWHCWYGVWKYDPERFAKTRDWYDLEVSFLRLAYARSSDGVHWEKPALGIHKVDGRDTNIILGDEKLGSFYIVTPIDDPLESDPAKRFKCVGVRCSKEIYRIEAAYSADGIHWTFYDRPPCFGTWGPYLNDEITLHVDPVSRLYVATVRSPYQGRGALDMRNPTAELNFVGPSEPGAWWKYNKRRVFQTESPDLLHWSQPYPIFQPDEIDNLDESYYGMCQTRVGDTLIAFVNLFRECENTMHVRLAYSYDGKNWEWADQRRTWLTSAKMSGRDWDSIMIYLGSPPIGVGDEDWVYYAGAKNHHDWFMTGCLEGIDHPEARDMSKVGYHLGLAKMRRDGYVSLTTSPHREGIMVTRPCFMEGNRIVLNAKTAADGFVGVEVRDENAQAVTGYSREEFDTFRGDSVRHVCTWKGRAQAEFRGYYKLIFTMRKAELYSFQSTDDPSDPSSVDGDLSRKLSVRKWE